jgi:hypothetical protein
VRMPYDAPQEDTKMILDDLAGALEIECAVAIVANPNLEAGQPFSTQLHHVVATTCWC